MNELMQYAMSFLGVPYIWGGNNRLTGMDCSGLVCELLRSAGEIGSEDLTAQGIYDKVHLTGSHQAYLPGALAFFGESVTKITHVGMLVDKYRMIEAGGGGRECLTVADAAKRGAMVRIRPLKSRKDLVAVIRPRYYQIGLM